MASTSSSVLTLLPLGRRVSVLDRLRDRPTRGAEYVGEGPPRMPGPKAMPMPTYGPGPCPNPKSGSKPGGSISTSSASMFGLSSSARCKKRLRLSMWTREGHGEFWYEVRTLRMISVSCSRRSSGASASRPAATAVMDLGAGRGTPPRRRRRPPGGMIDGDCMPPSEGTV
jgi:hypothetical protein